MHKERVLVLLVCALTLIAWSVQSFLAGKITACDVTSSVESGMQCSEKMSVTLTLQGGDAKELQYEIKSGTKDGQESSLEDSVSVSIRQENYAINYPLLFRTTFNAKPSERIIRKTDVLLPQCIDSPSASNPTCGWVKRSDGTKIRDSQGFCCACRTTDLVKGNPEGIRGSLNCQTVLQKQSSAHCLTFSDTEYNGFEVLASVEAFTIEIKLDSPRLKETLVISPSNRAVSKSGVAAELVGNFASFQQRPNFENSMLFVPKNGDLSKQGSKYWMVVDKSMVSMDGSECGKIGTSYSAFRNQANGCKKLPMSCLENQLTDLHERDVERDKKGLSPLFWISRYGKFESKDSESNARLVLFPQETGISMVNLMIDTSKLSFKSKRSTGKFLDAGVTIVSMNSQPELFLTITNTGSVAAPFRVVPKYCTEQIMNTLLEQRIEIAPREKKSVTFVITISELEKSEGACEFSLQDLASNILDNKRVAFDIQNSEDDQSTDHRRGSKETESASDNLSSSCNDCKLYNVVCTIVSRCWKNLILGIVAILIVAGTLIFCIAFTYCGGWQWCIILVKCCCSCFVTTGKAIRPPKALRKYSKQSKRKNLRKYESGSETESDSDDERQARKKKLRKKLKQLKALKAKLNQLDSTV